VCVGERTTALNCQQLRFYCAKMHLCIFLMAQFRTKTDDIGKNNIAWSTAVEGGWLGGIVGWLGWIDGWLGGWVVGGGSPDRWVWLDMGGCKKTNNCGNSRITVACPAPRNEGFRNACQAQPLTDEIIIIA